MPPPQRCLFQNGKAVTDRGKGLRWAVVVATLAREGFLEELGLGE